MSSIKWFDIFQIIFVGLIMTALLWLMMFLGNFFNGKISDAEDALDKVKANTDNPHYEEALTAAQTKVDEAWNNLWDKAELGAKWVLIDIPVILIFCGCKIVDDVRR